MNIMQDDEADEIDLTDASPLSIPRSRERERERERDDADDKCMIK